ncbi:MAG TPA: hypothetical protein VH309_10620 [Elusimicrobiota bacterium]|jgi:hypothetical protein|nr:hypothetical protein [Elusimicrobiota bacterium]
MQSTLLLALAGLCLAAASSAAPQKIDFTSGCKQNRSAELKALADADQKDRPDNVLAAGAQERDLARRKRVGEIFGEGCLRTGKDYENAALVFQHGTDPEHYLQTYIWAAHAVALGDEDAQWLISRGIDRYLMHIGRKQLYATQSFGTDGGCSCLWPVEKTSTDDDRRLIGAPTVAEQLKEIDGENEGKLCGHAGECAVEAAPTPKGSIPGVAW